MMTSVEPTGTSAHGPGYESTPSIHHPQVMIRPRATIAAPLRSHRGTCQRGNQMASRPPASGSHRRERVS
ncbi:Uncharacterised protein [Mycobacteroides abscessus subsp. abscessus]|nr:Uncharacterised protein [Mycobacteroides abscessus subsp. abscessus]